MKEMTLDTVVKRNEDIFMGSIDNETVAMSIQNGKYYQMNETASRILGLLDQERSISELCEIMQGSYRVEAPVCRGDVLDFVERMAELGLIETI
ncbi:PqqD family peptide modification chaperone [Desulfatiglans anilini]|uniref:PqqD family peptide modification chaperone n=1 Tax=Desulfatiglans anilini TaxID=90728 RepID=UPI0003F7695D|nr:PqqD family peptide modification chaperone [Desulfatiglans anilini]